MATPPIGIYGKPNLPLASSVFPLTGRNLVNVNQGVGFRGMTANPNSVQRGRVGSSSSVDPQELIGAFSRNVGRAVPYLTNLVNAGRRVPRPRFPNLVSPVSMGRVNLQNERNEIDRMIRGADLAAERGLTGNAASATRAANLVQGLRARGDSYMREANANTQIQNDQARTNMQIAGMNAATLNQYQDNLVGAEMAQQRVSSENLANFADKLVADQNRRSAENLETTRAGIMSRAFSRTGVQDRLVRQVLGLGENAPITDEERRKAIGINMFGGRLKKVMASGGPITPPGMISPKTLATSSADNSMANSVSGLTSYLAGRGDVDANYLMKQLTPAFGQGVAQRLVTAADIYRSNPQYMSTPEAGRISGFYSTVSSDPELQTAKERIRTFGASPTTMMNNTPDPSLGTNSLVSRMAGGKIGGGIRGEGKMRYRPRNLKKLY